jgi:hypothetical protein
LALFGGLADFPAPIAAQIAAISALRVLDLTQGAPKSR